MPSPLSPLLATTTTSQPDTIGGIPSDILIVIIVAFVALVVIWMLTRPRG